MTLRARLQSVAVREYVPLAGLALTWLAIGATVGHADAVRLLGAVTFVRAAPALLAPATMPFLRKRMHLPEYRRQAAIVGFAVEAIALTGALLALVGIVGLLWSAGQTMLLTLCLLFAPALPVRLIMPLTAARATGGYYRQSLAIAGVGLALAGLVLGADVYGFAILYAVREWLGLGIAWLLAPRQDPNLRPRGPMNWRAVASYSHARGRKVVAYRFSKVFLHAVLGPFGSIAARTGRGFQLDRKLERFVPRHPAALALAGAGMVAASTFIIFVTHEPGFLVAAASMMRMASTAGSVLIWGWVAGSSAEGDSDEFDEDEF